MSLVCHWYLVWSPMPSATCLQLLLAPPRWHPQLWVRAGPLEDSPPGGVWGIWRWWGDDSCTVSREPKIKHEGFRWFLWIWRSYNVSTQFFFPIPILHGFSRPHCESRARAPSPSSSLPWWSWHHFRIQWGSTAIEKTMENHWKNRENQFDSLFLGEQIHDIHIIQCVH